MCNSIRNKFDMFPSMMKQNTVVAIFLDTKNDSSISREQFVFEVYALPFKYGRNSNGGVILHVR